MRSLWPIAFAVSVISLSFTVYHMNRDPKEVAMEACTQAWPDAEMQIECARAIFGNGDQ